VPLLSDGTESHQCSDGAFLIWSHSYFYMKMGVENWWASEPIVTNYIDWNPNPVKVSSVLSFQIAIKTAIGFLDSESLMRKIAMKFH